MYIVRDKNHDIEKIKQSVISEIKHISLAKKDRNFLLSLIELFDWLSIDENERFLAKLEKLALAKDIQDDEEFKIRLSSLQMQLEANKNLKIIHFPAFSMYFQVEKIDIYIKKLPASWDDLVNEIKKIEFDHIIVNVYKSTTKKEKLLATRLKKEDQKVWDEELKNILDNHIHTNTKITLFYVKQKL